jgi:hypothetical protein
MFDPTMLDQVKVFGFFLFPLLDLSYQEVLMLSAKDPKEKHLSQLYVQMVTKNQKLVQQTSAKKNVFKKVCDYAKLLDYFRGMQQVSYYLHNYQQVRYRNLYRYQPMELKHQRFLTYLLKQVPGSSNNKYFRFPSQEEHFKDIITTGDWQDDKVFVEQRLAGMNPVSLRKLGAEGIMSHVTGFCKLYNVNVYSSNN